MRSSSNLLRQLELHVWQSSSASVKSAGIFKSSRTAVSVDLGFMYVHSTPGADYIISTECKETQKAAIFTLTQNQPITLGQTIRIPTSSTILCLDYIKKFIAVNKLQESEPALFAYENKFFGTYNFVNEILLMSNNTKNITPEYTHFTGYVSLERVIESALRAQQTEQSNQTTEGFRPKI